MTYEPLHHKYRPQTFAELVGQEAITATLSNALRQQRIAPAYLFTGARGTGKTSSARILAKSLNCLAAPVPTAQPCGQCEVCRAIANGSALDIIEIDAASNTGVDNIRDLIEKAQFAPVQCRYKVYVVDECLTGETLITTDAGLLRIDDPSIKGKEVLSYHEASGEWELKPVVRWLDQGERQTYVIETEHCKIKCTGNHLIRTATGWIAAKDIKAGTKILSPVNVGAAHSSLSLGQTDEHADLLEDTNSKGTNTGKKPTILNVFLNRLNHCVPSVHAGVARSLKYLALCKSKATESLEFYPDGKNTLTNQSTDFGTLELRHLSLPAIAYPLISWGLFTALCWETVPSPFRINTADSQDYLGPTESYNKNGRTIRQSNYLSYAPGLELDPIKGTGKNPLPVIQPAILSLLTFINGLSRTVDKNKLLSIGSIASRLKDWLGGIWMMAHSALAPKEALESNSIQKATLWQKIILWLAGSHLWAIERQQNRTPELITVRPTTTLRSGQLALEPFWQTYAPLPFQQWHTSLETVKSVSLAGVERVYDIEVEDNHNFVANGLLVHNCHMLSTAAFNALLKTLEEPPDRVVFVLATTDPQRVLPTIISRCQRFDFRRIPLTAMVEHLTTIAAKETIPITADALTLVGQIAQGGLRDAESLLDQLSLLSGEITAEQVWDLVGSVPERDLLSLLEAIAQDDPETMLDSTRRLMDRGREPLIVLQNLASFYRDLLIAKTAPDRHDLIAVTLPTWERLCQFAQQLEISTILLGQHHLRSAEVQLKNTTQPRLWLEITLMGLLPSAITGSIGTSQPTASQPTPARVTPAKAETRNPVTPAATPTVERSPEPPISQPPPVTSQTKPSPAPEPPAPPEAPPQTPPSAIPTGDVDLEQVWQKVLGLVQPYSTQIMLRQQCQLLGFNGQEARIGARSQKLFNMAKERLPNVEAAFTQFCQHPVRVGLEVILAGDSLPPAASSHPTLDSGISKPQRNVPPDPPPSQRSPMPQPPEPPAIAPIPDHQTLPPLQPPLSDVPESSSAAGFWQDDPVTQAAKQLAEFFAGKVVDVDDDILQSGSTFATDDLALEADLDDAPEEAVVPEPNQTPPTPPNPLSNSVAETELGDDEDDDDIPF